MRLAVLALVVGVGGALAAAAPPPSAVFHPDGGFMDGPPVRSSGGFGEPSCIDCHWGEDINDPRGSFRIEGVPDVYQSGERYTLAVVLTRPDMAVGGFQLTARFAEDGREAGVLAIPTEEEERLALVEERGVHYAQQRLAGMDLVAPDTARWVVYWTAPTVPGDILFHAAGNVGDGDDSQIGDFVYTVEAGTTHD